MISDKNFVEINGCTQNLTNETNFFRESYFSPVFYGLDSIMDPTNIVEKAASAISTIKYSFLELLGQNIRNTA